MIERCKAEIVVYDPHTASVGQMQSYAACVRAVYPDAHSTDGLRVIVAILLVAMVIGGFFGKKMLGDDSVLLNASFGGIVGLLVACVAGLVIAGIAFVLGA